MAKLLLAARPSIERLEDRRLLSVSIDSDGWTTLAPSAATRVIYVSSSAGSDNNNGLSPANPVASIAKGVSLLRNDSSDWLLLKCGDTWNSGLGAWRLSGKSNDQPMLIGSYGSGARPLLETGTGDGFFAGASSSPEVDHIDIIGLHFYADGRDPNSRTFFGSADATGIDVLTQTNGITIENCWMEDYSVNINLQSYLGQITDAQVRRNIIDDSYSVTGHSQGLYCYGVANLLIQGNTFDADGYNDQIPGAQATYFNHDCYLSSNNTNVTIDNNIFARAAGYGLQDRPGGTVENNVFIDDPIGMSFGLVNGATSTPGGVSGIVNGNVFIGGGNLNGAPYGQGIVIGNTAPGYPTVVSNNIFADSLPNAPAAINLMYGSDQINPQDSVGLNDVNILGNVIYDWNRGVYVEGGLDYGGAGLTALNDVNIQQNDFQDIDGAVVQSDGAMDMSQLHFADNTYSADAASIMVAGKATSLAQWTGHDEPTVSQQPVSYVDATRTLSVYDAALGGAGSDADFLAGARLQSQQSWRPDCSAAAVVGYFQAGFDGVATGHDWTAPTPPIVTAVGVPPTVVAKTTSLTFTVTYLGEQPIDLTSLSSGNLTVTAPRFSAAAQYVSQITSGNATTAVYTLSAPTGLFRQGRSYKFKAALNADQIADTGGFLTPAQLLGTFKVRVIRPPKVQPAHRTH
ncbi:MAG TPA: right-handed parallel beta-helix repeat-containing protein [Tepidisphaeraceae bacterium]|nr:right-handed parallel beta-helix repeat-containing protein [Tepidisphaeraceae bacterium]